MIAYKRSGFTCRRSTGTGGVSTTGLRMWAVDGTWQRVFTALMA
ncbi:hypothetical protein [Streptomyces flaveolus]